ncbi:SDR family oxidoreductase [Rhodopirellula sp. SWK7]|uniref:SDR family oxidoreductase n=1 Tax=Rhodopirellula sp. SWK7 TaxID=595460 RepID=UPI0002BE523A|nr:SDR family oxidoreductase [Rhodopirellula sp. SWK7]EMI43764.1 short-chain dehydrogenase/reductase SDR [Rhodopirellula sp. SWK7]
MQNILITGATRGIGREVVRQLTESDGYRIFASGRDGALLDALKSETGCVGATCDLSDAEAVVGLYAKAQAELGQVDVLINNAGFNRTKTSVAETPVQALDDSYAVNYRAAYLLAREAMKEMEPRQSGQIVNVVSTMAKTTGANYSVYCAMKHALAAFTACLAKEAGPRGVKVIGIYPGGVDTDFRPEDRPQYLKPSSAAKMILYALTAPDDVVVHELVYRPMVELNF